jgi:hypothetical protein
MNVKVYYYRSTEEHFVATYGYEEGIKRYRNITFPLNDEVHVTDLSDHALVAELEIPDFESPLQAAEFIFMTFNSWTQNPLSAGYGLKDEYGGSDFEALSEAEKAFRRGHNRNSTKGKGVGHTSMSIGDIVEIDGRFFYCASIGFREIPIAIAV